MLVRPSTLTFARIVSEPKSGSDRIIDLAWNVKSGPSALADELKTQLEIEWRVGSVARFAGSGSLG